MNKDIIYTGSIPQCPYCDKPTKRTSGLSMSSTCVYFPPSYNEYGKNINPDRNTITIEYNCLECDKSYSISGNEIDGYNYK